MPFVNSNGRKISGCAEVVAEIVEQDIAQAPQDEAEDRPDEVVLHLLDAVRYLRPIRRRTRRYVTPKATRYIRL